jgi:glutamine amidotransferase
MIAIVDYGAGNLRSIQRAITHAGGTAQITSDPEAVRSSERVVLPGVGNAKAAMERLRREGLAAAVTDVANEGKPLLGVCLGMQLLFGDQAEGPTTGLGLLQGEVNWLPAERKVPHMGWNEAEFTENSPLHDLGKLHFYFVHSLIAENVRPEDIAATTHYGIEFPSVFAHGNIWGTQFHPEKSGNDGFQLVKRWVEFQP